MTYRHKFRKLVSRYLGRTASESETEAVEKYYALFGDTPDRTDQLSVEELGVMEDRIKSGIANEIRKQNIRGTAQRVFFPLRWAAVLVLAAGLVFLLYIRRHQVPAPAPGSGISPVLVESGRSNHFITLPDGSKALLRKGSRLTYSADFNTTNREVTLVGEAYFDVAHVSYTDGQPGRAKPFIIHTGKVKTTVLGTAFEIRAWPESDQVMVSVARGKVRVEDDTHLIAVLNKDDQVNYDLKTTRAEGSNIHVARQSEFLSWAREDMTFDGMPFATLAEHLENRYRVAIEFGNPELRHCSITGRFNGTETLEEVLEILTATSNTTYGRNSDGTIVIDGRKCN